MNLKDIHDKFIFFLEMILERSDLLSNIYTKLFTKITMEEFSMTKLDPLNNANVLIIGCRPIPHTVIILGKNTNWKIKGVDKNQEAVKKSNKYDKTI